MGFMKVILSRGVTINVGDFQNTKAEMLVEYALTPGESIEEARATASRAVREGLLAEIEPTLQTVSNWRAEHFRSLLGQQEETWAPPLDDDDEQWVIEQSDDDSDDDDWGDDDDELDDGFQTHSDDEPDDDEEESDGLTEKVISDLEHLRDSGKVSMLDFEGVIGELSKKRETRWSSDWLKANPDKYSAAIESMAKRRFE